MQALHRNIPPTIDFLIWPSLRDQLILYLGAYDPKQLFDDCLEATVVEDHSLEVSYRVIDAYLSATPSITTGQPTVQDVRDTSNPCTTLDSMRPSIDTKRHVGISGIERCEDRRLLPSFAEKYPFLDLTTITTKYCVVPYKTIEGYQQDWTIDDSAGGADWNHFSL